MKISQLLDQYLIVRGHQSDQYHDALKLAVRRFIEVNGDIFVGEITRDHIGRYLMHVGQFAKSAHTLRGYLAMIRALLNEALEIGVTTYVPKFPKLRVERRTPDAWTIEETQKLFQYVANLRGSIRVIPATLWWQSILLTNYYTGLRLSALMNIYWFHVDLQGGYIRAFTNKNKREQLFQIPPELVALLQKIKDPPREKVWQHPYGNKWPHRALRRIVDRVGIPAPKNLHGQLFQKMRRTCITWTAVHDLSMATRVAGHASPETTIKHYVDPRMLGAIRPAVPKLEIKIG